MQGPRYPISIFSNDVNLTELKYKYMEFNVHFRNFLICTSLKTDVVRVGVRFSQWRSLILVRFKSSVLLALFLTCSAYCNKTSVPKPVSTCNRKDIYSTSLDVAIEMISIAKCNMRACNNCPVLKAVDCTDILQMGQNKSGVYEISPTSRVTEGKSFNVYCDMDTSGGGWTVIQRRGDFQRAKDFFFQDWKSYKEGFGNLDTDFWLGNDNICALTNQKVYSARFDLKDVQQNHRYALYDKFWIDDESNKYTLHISDYSGNAKDSIAAQHNNQKFSTKDQDNDSSKDINCALTYKGAWWHNNCHFSNLNGLYHKGEFTSNADGVSWHAWKGHQESLEWTEIKIRPKHFKPSY